MSGFFGFFDDLYLPTIAAAVPADVLDEINPPALGQFVPLVDYLAGMRFGIEPPKPRIEAIRIVDMSASNAWAEFAGVFARTQAADLEQTCARR